MALTPLVAVTLAAVGNGAEAGVGLFMLM